MNYQQLSCWIKYVFVCKYSIGIYFTFLAFSFACFLNCWKESAVEGFIVAPAAGLFASGWANELQTFVELTLWSDSYK